MENKVVLGLSGGVDSAVAARLLIERGFAVHGLYLDNGVGDPGPAREAAGELGIPFDTLDIRERLEREVCRPFAEAYLAGRTPNPCALCNPTVKFPALLEEADRLGARFVATGHYARAEGGGLFRGRRANDQSYMLARLTGAQLRRCLFPLGEYDKAQVRAMARDWGLAAAQAPDSMEICFIPDDDYPAWLEARGQAAPAGNFVDTQGNVLGVHKGVHRYTLGQGSGLGISGPHKYYVSAIRPETNEVVLSDGSDLMTREVRVEDLNWLVPDRPERVTVRFRHSRTETPARLEPGEDGWVLVRTDQSVRAPTPGQLAVFYEGERVIGGGWIKNT